MKQSDTVAQISVALHKFQHECPTVKASQHNEFFDSSYADLADVRNAIKEPLFNSGLSYVQGTRNAAVEGQIPVLVTRVSHISGEWLEDEGIPLIVEPNKKDKKTMQGMGSAITYARRQGLSSMLGVVTSDEDDDAALASAALPSRNEPIAEDKKPLVKKMKGPIKTKGELRTKLQELQSAIVACETVEELKTLRYSEKAEKLINQAKVDWPEAYSQERTETNDVVGIVQSFKEHHSRLEGDSE